MPPILHLHPLSSYCWKVLIALYETGAAFTPQVIDHGDPEALAAFQGLWATAKIPLLEDRGRGRVVPETSIIIEYLDAFQESGRRMLPADADERLQARLWDRLFDLYVMTPMQRIVAERIRHGAETSEGEAATTERLGLQKAYAMVDAHMAGRTWAAGDRFCLADCAAAPALFYALVIERSAEDLPHLAAYYERLMARPSVRRAIEEAGPWFQYFPFKDQLPADFLGVTAS